MISTATERDPTSLLLTFGPASNSREFIRSAIPQPVLRVLEWRPRPRRESADLRLSAAKNAIGRAP